MTKNKNEIRQLRERLAMTQEELARLLGVSARTVSRWELGLSAPSRLARFQIAALEKSEPGPGRDRGD